MNILIKSDELSDAYHDACVEISWENEALHGEFGDLVNMLDGCAFE